MSYRHTYTLSVDRTKLSLENASPLFFTDLTLFETIHQFSVRFVVGRSTPEILNGWQADHQNTPSIMTALAGVGRPNPDVRAAGDQSILEGT